MYIEAATLMWNHRPELDPSADTIDRRQSSRYPIPTTVEFLFDSGERLRRSTRDISASGFFVYVQDAHRIQEHVRFLIIFPEVITTSHKLLALCEGVVVRREPGDQMIGLAVKIQKYNFLNSAR
ncbi:MAG TPA: PilZ domain-containing protein [Candidatus Acidoferrales bacterium]|nr:PilZ domain-containing protein [Candidatus Acidoferrales bacterium]